MRFFFLLLCLANAIWFFWELHAGAFHSPTSGDSAAPSILLVSERENAKRGAVISGVLDRYSQRLAVAASQEVLTFFAPSDDLPVARRDAEFAENMARASVKRLDCFRVGPFADPQQMRNWLMAKSRTAFDSFRVESSVPGDFQVYFPPARDAEQLRINKMMLRAKGLNDVWPISSGDLKNALSLGVFREKSRAILYRDQLARQGIVAGIFQRNRNRAAWYTLIKQGVADAPQDGAVTFVAADCRAHRIGE